MKNEKRSLETSKHLINTSTVMSLYTLKSLSVPVRATALSAAQDCFSLEKTDSRKVYFFTSIFQLVDQVGRNWRNDITKQCTLIMGFQTYCLGRSSLTPSHCSMLLSLLLSHRVQGCALPVIPACPTELSGLCCAEYLYLAYGVPAGVPHCSWRLAVF